MLFIPYICYGVSYPRPEGRGLATAYLSIFCTLDGPALSPMRTTLHFLADGIHLQIGIPQLPVENSQARIVLCILESPLCLIHPDVGILHSVMSSTFPSMPNCFLRIFLKSDASLTESIAILLGCINVLPSVDMSNPDSPGRDL